MSRWIPPPEDLVLTRFVVLRALGGIYLVAFLTLLFQWPGLLGSHGLLPIARLVAEEQSPWSAFVEQPSIFWFFASDGAIHFVASLGVALALLVFLGFANVPILFTLWAIQLSIVHVGQDWYSFGWEIQLLETGFLALFLCPPLDPRPFPKRAPTVIPFVLLAWMLMRLMFGAGLIKLRGDQCWRDLTCLIYHYETQPIPHPLSWLLHQAPAWVNMGGVLVNHIVELVVPFFLLAPRRTRHVAAAVLGAFQITLILSGNLAFLNWLTLVPVLACVDDTGWRKILPRRIVERAQGVQPPSRSAQAVSVVLACLVAVLSVSPVLNLLSSQQAMNTSFNRLHLVNTYGAFGSVGKVRHEIILEGADALDREWREYEFKCKPGDPARRPCVITPYHLRLDWLMWFAAMGPPERYAWFIHLVYKLLIGGDEVLALMAKNPFPDHPPRYVRARLYTYHFTRFGEPGWWKRELDREYLPPLDRYHPGLTRALTELGFISQE